MQLFDRKFCNPKQPLRLVIKNLPKRWPRAPDVKRMVKLNVTSATTMEARWVRECSDRYSGIAVTYEAPKEAKGVLSRSAGIHRTSEQRVHGALLF